MLYMCRLYGPSELDARDVSRRGQIDLDET
jgi:hypothetical protein